MLMYNKVRLTASEHSAIVLDVPPWEVPVLAAVHGDHKIQVLGEFPLKAGRKVPEAVDEYVRLEERYKIDTDNGQSFVSMVYGGGAIGVRRLADEIARVTVQPEPEPEPEPVVEPKGKGKRKAEKETSSKQTAEEEAAELLE